jgi:hypothetical protein
MSRTIVAALVAVAATAALVAPTAVAAPAPPSQPPYEDCSQWFLQSWYPISADEPKWVFRCEWEDNFSPQEWTGSWVANDYYWNAQSSEIRWFATDVIDWGWYWSCVLYPYGVGACDA